MDKSGGAAETIGNSMRGISALSDHSEHCSHEECGDESWHEAVRWQASTSKQCQILLLHLVCLSYCANQTVDMALPIPPSSAASGPPRSLCATEALTPLIESTYTSAEITCYVNGKKTTICNPNPCWTLLDYLRAQPNLKGTKLGCGEGGCGACTVVLQVPDRRFEKRRIKHLAINACLFPLAGIDGKHVITTEGLGNVGHPHPLQERIAKLHGSQCGFCTPGIVMSLYAVIRNAYDPETKKFRLSARDIELEGHLDGNLCRCTGYKPILQAAKSFVTQDLKGELAEEDEASSTGAGQFASDVLDMAREGCAGPSQSSCGRPGGCCRDPPSNSCSSTSRSDASSPPTEPTVSSDDEHIPAIIDTSKSLNPDPDPDVSGTAYAKPLKSKEHGPATEVKTSTSVPEAPATHSVKGVPKIVFQEYVPETELIFPPALWKYEPQALCYGDEKKIWFRPTTLQQLVLLKDAYPSAKLVGGASEVQVEVRFKNLDFAVSVYVSDIPELNQTQLPSDAELDKAEELVIAANTPLTEVEQLCKQVCAKLGKRAMVLEALQKQLRYFAGRQIRNVASLAGNIATASPISDANPVLLAAGATLEVITKKRGLTLLPMSEFFLAYRTTSLPPDASLYRIRIPFAPHNARQVLKAYKQAKRKEDDIAIVTAAFRVRIRADGVVEDASIVFGGMGPMTKESPKTQTALLNRPWFRSETLDAALAALLDDHDLPYGVPGGMADYRKTLALSVFFRFWHEAAAEFGLGSVDQQVIEEIHRGISSGVRDDYNPYEKRVVGKQIAHLSGLKQCTGEAEVRSMVRLVLIAFTNHACSTLMICRGRTENYLVG